SLQYPERQESHKKTPNSLADSCKTGVRLPLRTLCKPLRQSGIMPVYPRNGRRIMQLTSLPAVSLDDPALYINRELSWLESNRRVLEEAQDPRVPALEQLKFLAIFTSNLDEFFMVRVGGLQQKVHAGVIRGSGADRMPPRVQLERISQVVRQMVDDQYRCLMEKMLP